MTFLIPRTPSSQFGKGFVKNSATGLYDVDAVYPQPLSGPLLATDVAFVAHDPGTAGGPNLVPYSIAMSALLNGNAAPAPTPVPTPSGGTISADGTLSGLPMSIIAGQSLSAVTFTAQSSLYLVLFRVSGGIEEGSRWAATVMPGGTLSLLIPQTVGAYTVRGFSTTTASTATYESAQFTVTAAPGALPATPTQTADTGATSSGATMHWTATAPNYHVLARSGVGSAYGSLVNTTVSTNSYSFTGLSANASPRAVIIPQNANGSGTPSGQFLSTTTA